MSNLREWILQGDQQGCRSAAMDPSIKLFGQTIGVSSTHTDAGADAGVLKPTSASPWDAAPSCSQDGGDSIVLQAEEEGVVEKNFSARSNCSEDFLQPPKSREVITEHGAPSMGAIYEDSEGARSEELKEAGHNHADDKNPQKPDKVVACPRCDSLDTKFCYYNNYNVNQPRHFCKNCQRYWTAGGTLRNVPVGAGRRKHKHGGLQRDGFDGPAASTMQSDSTDSAQQLLSCSLGSPTSQKVTPLKIPQPKRLLLPGQGSPLRSPGSTSSFGQDSGLSMSSPYSLHQGGCLPFQSFSCTQGFMASGTDVSTVGSSDSASTQCQRLVQFPSSGFDKEGNRTSVRGNEPDTKRLSPLPSFSNMSKPQLELSGTYRSVSLPDAGSWANNGAPFGYFNGDWPYGYHLEWNGNHPGPPPQQRTTFSTPVSTSFGACPTPPPNTESWSPAPWATWASSLRGTPILQSAPPAGWSSEGQAMGHGGAPSVQSSAVTPATLGKRPAPESGRVEAVAWPPKSLRTDEPKENPRNLWAMLGKDQPEVSTSGSFLKLFQPKVENTGVHEERNNSFINKHFTAAAIVRPVKFQVTT